MMDDKEPRMKVIDRSVIWQGSLQTIELVRMQKGGTKYETAIMHGLDGAVIFAVNDSRDVALVQVYRLAVDDLLIELPAGKIERGEEPLEGAKRELLEETGLTAQRWQSLGMAYGSQGASSWKCYYYLATDLTEGTQSLAPDEEHKLLWIPLSEVWNSVDSGYIRDNFSIVGISKSLAELQKRDNTII